MTSDYLAVDIRPGAAPEILQRARRLAQQRSLTVAVDDGKLLIACSERYACHRIAASEGIILGDVFHRHVPATALDGSAEATRQIVEAMTIGSIAERYWGSFIIFHRDPLSHGFTVHRSPFGSINAYLSKAAGVSIVASDADLIAALSERRPSVDWNAVGHQLIWDDLAPRETCLSGVLEIRSGETFRASSSGQVCVDANWSPWDFTSPAHQASGEHDIIERLRREIGRCIGAYASSAQTYTIDLSGGLDSSIIAAASTKPGLQPHCLTVFSPQTEGDERGFARLAAAHAELPITEVSADADEVDILKCVASDLPRPHARSFVQEFDRAGLMLAKEVGASTFFHGGGGDGVFCHLQSSAPAADALRAWGNSPGYWSVAFEVARAAQCNVSEVVRKSLLKSVSRSRQWRWRSDSSLVSKDALAIPFTATPPWPAPSRAPLPGKIEHVFGLYNSCYNMNGFGRRLQMRPVYPLLSQPLVETCLGVASWRWLRDGCNRFLAREAMAVELPPAIAWRTSKGGLGRLQTEIFVKNQSAIREMLLDGLLRRAGLLDAAGIDINTGRSAAFVSDKVGRLLRLCDIEIWARSWS